MKKKEPVIKKSFLSKFLIKFIRKLGYEVIDQATLHVPTKNLEANENLSESGKKSITVPLGKTKVNKKIDSLAIIIRSYTFGDIGDKKVMLDQNKKRIFDSPKIEYTLRTIKSVIRSCEIAKRSFKDINIKIIISDDNSNQENLDKINQILQSTNIETQIISIKDNEFNDTISSVDTNGDKISDNMISNMRNILKSILEGFQ